MYWGSDTRCISVCEAKKVAPTEDGGVFAVGKLGISDWRIDPGTLVEDRTNIKLHH